MNTEKIKILQDCIDGLERGDYTYEWTHMGQCNCGIVAQVALGLSASKIKDLSGRATDGTTNYDGPWTRKARHAIKCKSTNIPVSKVFQMLEERGFTLKEIVTLEFMRDKKVLAKMGRKTAPREAYSDKNMFLRYLRAWIEVLQEEEQIAAIETGTDVHQSINNDLRGISGTKKEKEILNG